MLNVAAERLSRARTLLERQGIAPAELLTPEISASWQRCLEVGLDPHKPISLERIQEQDLSAARDRAGLVRLLALAEMQALYRQIAGSNFLIAFADADGVLLETVFDTSFGTEAKTANIRPGTLWTERLCGTNALGTTALLGQAVTVHGGEHFFSRHGTLTCTASPIFGPDGKLAGVLDASSQCGSRQQHTTALVGMAATQVENGLFRKHHGADVVIAFHNRGEYLHTLSAGLLALAPSGAVIGANRQARFLLQGLPALPGRHFDDVFRVSFARMMECARRGGPLLLEDRVGSSFIAVIETLRPVIVPVPPAPPRRGRDRTITAPVAAAGFVADDPAVVTALRIVASAAQRTLPILIRGETGTGKEQLARYAHQASRRPGAFIPVNCAALSDSLIEAELFGHAEGAFTGARRGGAHGLVWEANGGTLFLDEIGDMPLARQTVLLRLLDDWTVRPVGGGPVRQADVLLIAATNVDLDQAVVAGRFRADLFHRLGAVDVLLPPLRARQDMPQIVSHLLADIAPAARLTPGAVDRIRQHAWLGNVRQLRNMLNRLTLLDPAGLFDEHAVAGLLEAGAGRTVAQPAQSLQGTVHERITTALRETGGNLSESARRLGVSRNRIYRVIGRGGDAPPEVEAPRTSR